MSTVRLGGDDIVPNEWHDHLDLTSVREFAHAPAHRSAKASRGGIPSKTSVVLGRRPYLQECLLVLVFLLAMLGIVLLAGLVVVYVAFPHRGHQVPSAPWIGKAMRKGVDALPTLDNQNHR